MKAQAYRQTQISKFSLETSVLNDDFIQTILETLPDHEIVSDVALGESPTFGKVEINGKKTEWYGYVRLLVLSLKNRPPVTIESVISPVGEKHSAFSVQNYRSGKSVDKGAVGVFIKEFNLSVLSLHLMGTNKYDVPERVFDTERRKQLTTIDETFDIVLDGRFEKSRKIIVGDYNFRCEKFHGNNEKSKGGKDWEAVRDSVEEGKENSQVLRTLFNNHDRLRRWMKWIKEESGEEKEEKRGEEEYGKKDKIPKFIKTCSDVFENEVFQLVTPTFTYSIAETEAEQEKERSVGRPYAKKRTPSWTDRILVSDSTFEILALGKCQDIVVSDHEPVWCALNIKD